MKSRPIGDLVNALKELGVKARCIERDGFPPVLIKANGIHGGKVKISGRISSQYISSLLLSAPYAKSQVEIEIEGQLVSKPYVNLTLDVMHNFGVDVEQDEYKYFRVPPGTCYQSRDYTIEGDVSSASYFWGAAAITQGRITTDNIYYETTRQGDISFLDVLERMGCYVEREKDFVVVNGAPLSGVNVDMGAMPDMVPTLAAIALFAKGRTIIRNVPHLRYKESDRIGDTAMELRKVGGKVEVLEDGLIINGGQKLNGAETDPHNDHRLAMSLAMVGLMVPGIEIMNENCVDKSFPKFWDLWDKL
jgi:3-phosphoshikimate 1-carboxyvinyltransferase